MGDTILQRAFAAGELAPSLGARADLAKYTTGLRTCRNFIVQRHGGVTYRHGTMHVAEAKPVGARAYLKPFVFQAADESYAIECGDYYFRFHHRGAPVRVSGVVAWSNVTAYVAGDLASAGGVNFYCLQAHTNQPTSDVDYWYPLTADLLELPTPYSAGAFTAPAPACFAQSGNIITITNLGNPPMELQRWSATHWTLTLIVTGPGIAAPLNPAGVAGAAGARTFAYVVTAADAETYEESDPSAVITIPFADAPTALAKHALTWDAVPGAAEYYVYGDPYENGTFGFLGVATGIAGFFDVGLEPDFAVTPPVPRELFTNEFNYPAVSTMYQQRRVFAGSHNARARVWASQVGFRSNFAIRTPLQDDDAVTFEIASNTMHIAMHLVGLKRLVILTDNGEWRIHGDESGTLRPTAITPEQHGYVGASPASPVVVGESLLFVQNLGSVLRDLRFDLQIDGLSGRDLSLYATHLFAGHTITELAYAQVPHSVVWCVRSDGVLLGLTYIRDEDVWGWHRHDTTNGHFISVCVIPEDQEHAVYVMVERTVGGTTRRFVERFAARPATLAASVHLDRAVTYSGAATTAITGLDHLNGQVVRALADGVPQGPFTVSGGSVTLPVAASVVTVGLPIIGELETLDVDVQGSDVRARRKRVLSLGLLLEASTRAFDVGPDAAHLIRLRAEPWEAAGLVTGQVEINPTSAFTEHGRCLIRHTEPLPLTVLGLLPHLEVGG